MSRLQVRCAATAAALALVLSIPAASAEAATRTFHDANRSKPGNDITTVSVTNGAKRVIVTVDVGDIDLDDLYTLWLDTVPDNAGPEYRFAMLPNSDYLDFQRVQDFDSTGTAVECVEIGGRADAYSAAPVIQFRVPRSCLNNPGKVRVSVLARYAVANGYDYDWGTGKKKLFGWVAQG
jgi:hypothetical protein